MQFQKNLELQCSLCQQYEGFHELSIHTNIERLHASVVAIKQPSPQNDIYPETTLPTIKLSI